MDVHQNATANARVCRVLLVGRILAGRPKVQVDRELGVSAKTADKWLRRYRDQGADALNDRRSRPYRSPSATPEVLRVAVLAWRRSDSHWWRFATQLQRSRSTVARIAKAGGLNRLTKLEPAPVYRRYERAEPGELLHLLVKKLGRIVAVGHCITGRHDTRGVGWEYVHVAIDDNSRVAYAQILPDEGGKDAVTFLRAVIAYYAGLGIPSKGSTPTTATATAVATSPLACASLGLSHHYSRPYTPRTNGKAERFIQTALREWAYAPACAHPSQRTSALPGFTDTTGIDPTPASPVSLLCPGSA